MDGIVLVNKPVGISSNSAVNIVKKALGAKKCGHLGTLDLEGEGLLLVTVGHATKLFDYFLAKDKTYETTFEFGYETDTLDKAGAVVATKGASFTEEKLRNALILMTGKYAQMPPKYSAKKVAGKNAYEYARSGQEVTLKPKEVEIFSFKLLEKVRENVYTFEITCSSGTYIRSVCRDLALCLGTLGTMLNIKRTRSGNFFLKDAKTLDEIRRGDFEIIPCQDVFSYENITINDDLFFKISNGQKVNYDKSDGTFKLFHGQDFLGVAEVKNKVLSLKLRLF